MTVPSLLSGSRYAARVDVPVDGGQVLDVHKADDGRICKQKTDIS